MDLATIIKLLQDVWVSLIQALGIIWPEVWTQMAIFALAYVALSQLVFKPYMKAYGERQKGTEGNEQMAERLLVETEQMQKEYEKQAKVLNSQYKAIYDQSRGAAMHERDQIIERARAEVSSEIEKSKVDIERALVGAQAQLEREVPSLATHITSQLIGRELIQ